MGKRGTKQTIRWRDVGLAFVALLSLLSTPLCSPACANAWCGAGRPNTSQGDACHAAKSENAVQIVTMTAACCAQLPALTALAAVDSTPKLAPSKSSPSRASVNSAEQLHDPTESPRVRLCPQNVASPSLALAAASILRI